MLKSGRATILHTLFSIVLLMLIIQSVHATTLSVSLVASNSLVDSGQSETLTAYATGGIPPYTANFFNVTSGSQVLSEKYWPWTTANSYPTNVQSQSCTAISNNIYCVGGYSTQDGYDNAVYYAPILSSNAVGAWTTANSYPTNVQSQSCTAISNNIYCVGGYSTQDGNDNAVYYAPILSSNAVGAWTTANSYPTNVQSQSCTAISNNIYCVGGYTSAYGYDNAVYYAPILSSNAVGAWTTANSYPTNVEYQSCTAISNNIYCVGGYTSAYGYDNAVYYAPILSSNAVGAWTTANSYPTNVEYQSCTAISNNIYCVGGYSTQDGYDNAVYYAPILSSNAVGAWTTANSYPTNVEYQSCTAISNNIYCVGGYSTQDGYDNAVYYAPILSSGTLITQPSYTFLAHSPTQGNTFQYNVVVTDSSSNSGNSITKTITVTFPKVTISSNIINIQNGQSETLTANIVGGVPGYAINFFNVTGSKTSQVLGYQEWVNTTSYPIGIDYQDCITYTNTIYCVGGYNVNYNNVNSVYYAPVTNSGPVTAWTTANSYPTNVQSQSCTAISNNIYCVGGYTSAYGNDNAVYYAPILSSNAVGAWTTANSYPTNVEYQSCTAISNNIYCVGGYSTQDGNDNAVYYAPILSSNAVGAWTTANSYPTNVQSQSCTAISNNIYCVGGYSTQDGNDNAVYYAPILSSNAVGAWTTANSYPTNVNSQSCTAISNNIYCVGGYTGTVDTNYTYYAPVFSSGAVGAWKSTISFPLLTDNSGHSCVALANNIYCIGGEDFRVYDNVYYGTVSPYGLSNSLNYSFIVNSPTANNALKFNISVIDSGAPLTVNSITNTICVSSSGLGCTTTSTSTSVTTTTGGGIIPSGGGGAGGSGGATPTVQNYTANVTTTNGTATQMQVGYILRNFSTDNCKTLYLKNKSISLCVSYITKANASIIVNNATYTLTQNTPIEIDPSNGWVYYAKLLNITYIPIEHAINLLVFAQSAPSSISSTSSTVPAATTSALSTVSGTTAPTTTEPASTSSPTTISQAQPSQPSGLSRDVLIIVAVIIIIVVIYYAARPKGRGRKR